MATCLLFCKSSRSATMNDGKKAEGYVQDALKVAEARSKFTFVRLYDSKSAGLGKGGNIIPPQPADYIVLFDGVSFLLEVKSSERHHSLAQATLRDTFSAEQMLGVRLWERAGGGAVCAFYSLVTNLFEIWDSRDIREAYNAPARSRKLKAEPLASNITNHSAVLSSALTGALRDYSR